ncbi:uncharacterized protein NDAI_0A02920 [Naumovozyma dairenensis CBS 421]|uniref:PX domain-containing protein n=1 Tax=Naumovozyma dairenensis (strain ATCC 10597 / BCRC 20456 / CBS 421 / NBRC 0211 / NRRL Y-12639) TaxID=1071378 RepID=G0W3R1_NAUDC|nr:hypothetical protein NDAI_0A02920 [Naumovozyma dairenensis CBS 421]CCD22449.1 hypothetical protein NDAI_0A02920 [Naumovozyma dairenensis CBS 421]
MFTGTQPSLHGYTISDAQKSVLIPDEINEQLQLQLESLGLDQETYRRLFSKPRSRNSTSNTAISTERESLHVLGTSVQGQTLRTDSNIENPIHFQIRVNEPIIKRSNLPPYQHVPFPIITTSRIFENEYIMVTRRYADFRWLYRQLQNNHWGKIIPVPPPLEILSDLRSVRRWMESMLHIIMNDSGLQNDKDFHMFLTCDNFEPNAKSREYVSKSGACDDNNDLSEIHISMIKLFGEEDGNKILKEGGIDGAYQNHNIISSFMNSVPKYSEPDEWFDKRLESISSLQIQLSELNKALKLASNQRDDVVSVINEFSIIINSLSDLEGTKQGSTLFHNYANIFENQRDFLKSYSDEERMLKIEYLEFYKYSLESMKAILNQRSKLGYFMTVVKADMSKSKILLEKQNVSTENTENAKSEKLIQLEQECHILERRYHILIEQWEQISSVIKEEVSKFNVEVANTFRANVADLLKSFINLQKENIDSFTTFQSSN